MSKHKQTNNHLRKEIKNLFKQTGYMDLYGSNDLLRLQVIGDIFCKTKMRSDKLTKLAQKMQGMMNEIKIVTR